MNRRTLLATVGTATAGLSGCLGLGADDRPPILLRAMRAEGNETDVVCPLDRSVLDEWPRIDDVLDAADDRPVYEWAETGVSEERAHDIVDALDAHCEDAGTQDGGLYRIGDDYYFVSVTPRGTSTAGLDEGDHEH